MNTRAVKNFFQMASLLLLLLAVALLSAITTMHFAIHGAEVQVPSLLGMTEEDARSETAGLGLNLDVDNRYYSADVAQSLGPQKVEVPDTVGRGERVAALTLRRVGLEVGATARLPYGKAEEGTVLAQDPPAHAQGIARPSVNLLVAAASDDVPDGFVMPELIGWPAVSAQGELERVGIKAETNLVDVPVGPVGSGDAPPRMPVRPGAVTAQSPPAGFRVEQGTVVRLTVAK